MVQAWVVGGVRTSLVPVLCNGNGPRQAHSVLQSIEAHGSQKHMNDETSRYVEVNVP